MWPVPRHGDRLIPGAIGHSGGVNKGFQALAAEVTGYSKNAFEEALRIYRGKAGGAAIYVAVLAFLTAASARAADYGTARKQEPCSTRQWPP